VAYVAASMKLEEAKNGIIQAVVAAIEETAL